MYQIFIFVSIILTLMSADEVTGTLLHETRHETISTHLSHSNIFKNRTVGQFEVTEWPQIGNSFVEERNKLVPYGNYEATHNSRKINWKASCLIEDHEVETNVLVFRLEGTNKSGLNKVSKGTKMSEVLKDVMMQFEFSEKQVKQTSAPAMFCLTGTNTTKESISIDSIFAAIKRGKRISTKPSANSTRAIRNANDKCSDYISKLTPECQATLLAQLQHKFLGPTASNRLIKAKFADSLTNFAALKHTKNNVKPYSHALQSIMTAARMGGADRHTIATGLGIGFDARYTRYEKVDERATKNLSTVENSLENTEITNNSNSSSTSSTSSTSTTSTTTTNTTPTTVTYVIDPKTHTFYGNRTPRKDSHEAMGLAQEYRNAFYHPSCSQKIYSGKNKPETWELLCPGVAVMIGYIERKRLETGSESFSVSWQRFKQERPKNVKDSKNKGCLCPHHLQHQCFVTALAEHRLLTHKKKSGGYGANHAQIIECDCPLGQECPGAQCTRVHRDVTYGMTCAVRGLPLVTPPVGDILAHKRLSDLPNRKCFCIDGNEQFCQDCFTDTPTYVHPTLLTAKHIPELDKPIYQGKIDRAVGCCALENTDTYDIDLLLKQTMCESKAKGSLKGKTKYAFLPTTLSTKDFFKKWVLYVPIFLIHAFTASFQFRQLGGDNGIIREEGGHYVTVSIDYSENWTHTLAFEHQSAYWSRSNSTVVPVIVCLDTCDVKDSLWRMMDIERGQFESERKMANLPLKIQVAIGFISEDKLHDKGMSIQIMEDTILWIKKFTTGKSIIVLSDGCRAQFKSCHMVGWMSTIPQKFGIRFQWHFHCSCHGKCLCDCVGGNWKHLAENAVTGKQYSFETAKDLFEFLQSRIDEGLTKWNIKKVKKAQGEKAGAYGIRIHHEVMKWYPRPGEVGSVKRGNVLDYKSMPGISLWHRFVALENGDICVSDLSCFCSACKDYRWADCPFIADTGKIKIFRPIVDDKKIKTEWSVHDSVELASTLQKDQWVIWHLSKRSAENKRMYWDNDWALGKYVGKKDGVTTITDEGTMVKIQPYRTSQIGDNIFIEQTGTTCTVDIQELLLSGLDIKVTLKKSVDGDSRQQYATKYFAPGDKKDGQLLVLRPATRQAVSIKLERWAQVSNTGTSSNGSGHGKNGVVGKSNSSKSGSNSSNTSSSSSSSSSSKNDNENENENDKMDIDDMQDETGDIIPTMTEYKCNDCGATSYNQMEIWAESSIHLENHAICKLYRGGKGKKKRDAAPSATSTTKNTSKKTKKKK